MATRLVRTSSGGSFAADITPADVVDRCERCRVTYREGDLYCPHLQASYGHEVALLADRYQTAAAPGTAAPAGPTAALAAVFRAPLADSA